MTTLGRPTALIMGRPAAFPRTNTWPPLGPVQEGLAHVAVDHQLALLHDLAQLVLSVAVDPRWSGRRCRRQDSRPRSRRPRWSRPWSRSPGESQEGLRCPSSEALAAQLPIAARIPGTWRQPRSWALIKSRASQSSPSGGKSRAQMTRASWSRAWAGPGPPWRPSPPGPGDLRPGLGFGSNRGSRGGR